MVATHRFDVRFGFLKPVFAVLGTGPARTELAVEGDALVAKMGWAFRASVPLRQITRVSTGDASPWLGIGVHGWRGTWQMNGTLGPVVTIEIEPPARARVLGLLNVSLRRLDVSVADPDHVAAALNELSSR